MKRQKKWSSKEEIEKAIDAAYRKILRDKKAAQAALDAEELFKGWMLANGTRSG